MSRIVLIGVAAVAVVALVVAFVLRSGALDGFGRGDRQPTVMIVTESMLNEKIEANLSASALQSLFPKQPAPAAEGGKSADAKPAKSPKTGNASTEKPAAPADSVDQAANLNLIAQYLGDSLAATLGDDFQTSGRFDVIAGSKIIDAMERGGQAAKTKGDKGRQVIASVSTGGASGQANLKQTAAPLSKNGLSEAAGRLKADWVLLVTMSYPTSAISVTAAIDGSARVLVSAQPIVTYEIFEPHGNKAYRGSAQLPKPVTEAILVYGEHQFEPTPQAALYKIQTRLNQAVSQYVLNSVLQQVAPPRVIRVGKEIVVNRGANDGVQLGAIYDVERETGEAERERSGAQQGRALERIRIPVGQIRVDRVQERLFIGSIVSGGAFARDDVVVFRPGASRSPGAAAGGAGAPLGSRALAQADLTKSGVKSRQVAVAIDRIVLSGAGQAVDSEALSRAIASSLQRDRRITVLPRKDLDQLLHERRLAARSEGEPGADVTEGLRTAGYLIVGEFRVSSSRRSNTVSVGGVSQTVSTSVSTNYSGTLRALSTDGALVEAVTVSSGGGLDAVADAAARALLLKLFPMKVVQVDAASGLIRLSRGEDAGLTAGARVRIYSLGERVVDPETGTLLSQGARTYVGDVVITQVDPSISTARFAGAPFGVVVGYEAQPGGGPVSAAVRPASGARRGPPRRAPPPKEPAEIRF